MKATMNSAGTMPLGFTLPIVDFIRSFVSFFAADDDDEKEEDDKFVDDLDEEDDDSLFGKEEDEDKDEEDDDSKEESKSKDKSAIHQKRRFRALYKQTKTELEEALKKLDEKDKAKDEPDPAKAKQEKEARNYLRGLIEEVLGERESKEERAQRELDEQLEELLEDNDDLTEKQVMEVVEELGVTPKQAVAAIRREQKASGTGKRAKPNVPRSKRGGESVSDKDDTKKAPMTLEEAAALAKKKLREMNSRN